MKYDITCLINNNLPSGTKRDGRERRIVPCVFIVPLMRSCGAGSRRGREGEGRCNQICENNKMSMYRSLRLTTLTVAECVAFAAHRVPPSYLPSRRGVATRWWGRSCGCCVVVPPERAGKPETEITGSPIMAVGAASQDGG